MSELRWNPLLEEWVTVAPWRQDRTYHPTADHCPLCPTRPGHAETEIPEPDYYIAVFENRFPSYAGEQGRCEVLVTTDDRFIAAARSVQPPSVVRVGNPVIFELEVFR